jgi:hypothetical protein
MEIYLQKRNEFGTITKSKDLVCIARVEKEITQVVNVWLRGNGDATVEICNYDESYLDAVKDYKTEQWEESTKEEFMEAYASAKNSLHTFQLSINPK